MDNFCMAWWRKNTSKKEEPIDTSKPYNKDGVWYNYYDDITEKDFEALTPEEQKHINDYKDWTMSPVEYMRYKRFCSEHRDCMVGENGLHRYGTIGGGIIVSFMSTGLGNIVHCKCCTCGQTYDITDNSCW